MRFFLAGIFIFAVFNSPAFAQDRFNPEINSTEIESLGELAVTYELADAFSDSGTNWIELYNGIMSLDHPMRESACWLVRKMPHLDRLEMTSETLQEHVVYAWMTKTHLPYSVPEELFNEYILTYRLGDEPVRPYRKYIYERYSDIFAGPTPSQTALNINMWVSSNFTVRERGFFGPRPDPISVISAKTGTEGDITAVAIACCKTFGIPARRAAVEVLGAESGSRTWLEIYSDGDWVPMYPLEPDQFRNYGNLEAVYGNNVTVVSVSSSFSQELVTSKYTGTGNINLTFFRNDEIAVGYEDFSVNAWNEGSWVALDDVWVGNIENSELPGNYDIEIGEGNYLIIAGLRNQRGDAFVRSYPLSVNSGETSKLDIDIDLPVTEMSDLELVPRQIEIPDITLDFYLGEVNLNLREFIGHGYTCIFLMSTGTESGSRMYPVVQDWILEKSVNPLFIAVGEIEDTGELNDSAVNFPMGLFYPDTDGSIAAEFGYQPDESGNYEKFPVVILINGSGEIIYFSEGLYLSVDDGLSRAMEMEISEAEPILRPS
ncbi:MAG TPA: transglutaminase domain-containing protein [bacterium]|jgi:hypothetical protein